MTAQTSIQRRCGTCRYYQPDEVGNWGTCTNTDLWPLRPQEVTADMHGCEHRGSRWTPIADPPPRPEAQKTSESKQSDKASPRTNPVRPPWVRWCLVGGAVGLLVIVPLCLIPDLLILIPGIPELTVILIAISLVLLGAGVYGYLFNK